MWAELFKFGAPAIAGLLVGLAVMTWVSPTTAGGQVLIMFVCTAGVVLAWWVVRRLVKKGKSTPPGPAS